MTNLLKKSVLAAALAATALAGSAPAMADGYHGYYHHGGDGAGTAVAAGIFGLALGAILVSSAQHHDRDDERYYARDAYARPYVEQNRAWHDGYYWDRDGNRYGRDGRYYGDEGQGYGYHRDGDHGDQRDYYRGRGY